LGEGDSSSGSDSEPSEDNLEPTELIKNLPTVDKNLTQALKKKANPVKVEERKASKSPTKTQKMEVNTQGLKRVADGEGSPLRRQRGL